MVMASYIATQNAPFDVNEKGYQVVRLQNAHGKQKKVSVHLLVLIAFVGPRPEGLQGRHLDDDKSNNRLSNLEWGTASRNMRERHLNRLTNPVFKMTPSAITSIRERLKTGETQRSIANSFGIHQSMVSYVKTGQRWGYLVEGG